MMIVFLLLVLEGVVTADVFLNHHWEQVFVPNTSYNSDGSTKLLHSKHTYNFSMYRTSQKMFQGICMS